MIIARIFAQFVTVSLPGGSASPVLAAIASNSVNQTRQYSGRTSR